jgi:hypothetical protein
MPSVRTLAGLGLTMVVVTYGAWQAVAAPSDTLEPDPLKVARSTFESQMKLAIDPVLKRYEKQLQKMESELTKKNETEAAEAVKVELKRAQKLSGMILGVPIQGEWTVKYTSGGMRTYQIRNDGTVRFVEENRVGRILRYGDDLLLDFGDMKLERLTMQTVISVEHYYPATQFLKGQPKLTGIAEKSK